MNTTLKPNLQALARQRVEQEEREWELLKRLAAAVGIFTLVVLAAEAIFVFTRGVQ